ncbi:hypothetical protein [Dyadobacter frigoris]|uniref:hypothetical protein n=1 Tax=Dyadobacter frigoris TaxID=2576211 RepID=UPI002557796A|nr:hypothetical protein [Dyadobacter frigoris]
MKKLLKGFLKGVGSVLDINPKREKKYYHFSSHVHIIPSCKNDEDNIGMDFLVVGDDMRKSLRNELNKVSSVYVTHYKHFDHFVASRHAELEKEAKLDEQISHLSKLVFCSNLTLKTFPGIDSPSKFSINQVDLGLGYIKNMECESES